jgi:hypothetical protein
MSTEGGAMAKKGPKREIIPEHGEYRALGRRVEALVKEKGLTKKDAARELAAAEKISFDRALRALEFSRTFEADEDLLRLGAIRVPASRGRDVRGPLSERYLRRLGIQDASAREAVLVYLESGEATFEGFEARLKKRGGLHATASDSGRLPNKPGTPEEALDQIERLTRTWLRRCKAHWCPDDAGERPDWLGEIPGTADRAAIEGRVSDVVEQLNRLRKKAEQLVGLLQPGSRESNARVKPVRERSRKATG